MKISKQKKICKQSLQRKYPSEIKNETKIRQNEIKKHAVENITNQ